MANTIESQTIHDGPRNLVLKIHLDSDGVTGELSAQNIVDISTFTGSPTKCRIKKVHSDFFGFAGELIWDADTDVHALGLPDYEYNADFTKIGGLPNNAGTGVTGDILITTSGFTAATDTGHIILELIKEYG